LAFFRKVHAAHRARTKYPVSGNLFALGEAAASSAEQFEELLSRSGVRVERIVSTGQASPPDFWYDQDVGEWVALLAGAAELQFEDEDAPRRMQPGDWVTIDAHRRHRVNWTDPAQPTVWLAIHYR
jgi:cupin 2 domain-containing protein